MKVYDPLEEREKRHQRVNSRILGKGFGLEGGKRRKGERITSSFSSPISFKDSTLSQMFNFPAAVPHIPPRCILLLQVGAATSRGEVLRTDISLVLSEPGAAVASSIGRQGN